MKTSLSLGAAALALFAHAAAAETLTISWWGYNGEKLDANIIEPFKKKCGCEIVFETGNNADRLNKLAARDGAGVDVIFLTDSYSQLGIEQGLFQQIDRAKLPNIAKIYDLAQDPQGDYGPAYTIGRAGIVYDSAKVQADHLVGRSVARRPEVRDHPARHHHHRRADGGDPRRRAWPASIAFADADAAFAKAVEALKPNVVKNYNTGSEMVNLISTGEATVAMAQDFTLDSLTDAVPTMTWADLTEGDIATLNTLNIPKGAANVDLAYQFIDFMLSTEIQQTRGRAGRRCAGQHRGQADARNRRRSGPMARRRSPS